LEVCVEKRGFNVRRVHVHVPLGSDDHECTQGAELEEWRERLRVVDSCSLTEPLSH
jgi:hypothetical protein